MRWCAYDTDFTPNTPDQSFKNWSKKCITSYYSVTNNNTFLTFQEFKNQFNLNNHDLFRYFQIRHYFNSQVNKSGDWAQNDLMKIFLSAYRANTISKVISKFYHCFQNYRSDSTSYVRIKWEETLL